MKMSPASPSPSLSWWGTAGETYFIQVAPDLGFGWQYIDAIYSGADAPLSHEFTGLGDTSFFRLRSTDQPTSDPWADNFDGDLLSNADEIRLFGTDPLVFDSDGDSLGDGYAIPGWVRTEVWEDIPDKQVTALTSDPGFPHAPDSAFWLQKLESPRDWVETYGTRTRGYILPPESGDYRFYLTADDQAEFWLSPDHHAFNKTRLIGPAGGSWNNWERKPEQISAPVSPVAYEEGADKLHLLAAGGGVNLRTADSNGFFYQTVTGDFSVTISYDQADQAPGPIAAGGPVALALMARESLDADSRYVGARIRRALSAFNLGVRSETGGESFLQDNLGSSSSYDKAWVRLERRGDRFIAYASPDHVNWVSMGEQSMELPDAIQLGFSVFSGGLLEYTATVIEVTEWKTDADRDGIWDADEALYGTSPTEADSDGDGYSDDEEVNEFYTDPLVADLSPAQMVARQDGSAAVASLGDWIEDGSVIYVAGGRGAVEYDLDVPEDAIYRLVLTAQNRSNQTGFEHYDIKVEVDGVYIGRLGLDDIEDAPGSDGILTPWLAAGTHRVRFFVENTYTQRVLQINSVELQFIGGADADLSGTPDWMENRLLVNNSVLNLATDGGITESAVSPFCLEGRSRYRDFSQSTDPALELKGLPDYGFYTDVPLDAGSDTTTGIIFENGGHSASGILRWTATDVLTTDDLTIREGDSLRLTAIDANDPSDQAITVAIDGGNAMSATESTAVEQRFDTAGTYTVSASVGGLSGTVRVTVLEAELGEPFDIFQNQPREWRPAILSDLAFVESDSRLELNEIQASAPRAFSLSALDSDPRYIAARTAEGGAVLDSVPVTGFRLASNNQARVEVVETFDDGAVMVEVDVVLDYVPHDLVIEARIFVAGVTFADGSLVRTLAAADFGDLGRATLQFIMPFEATASICHRLHMYLGDEYIGQF